LVGWFLVSLGVLVLVWAVAVCGLLVAGRPPPARRRCATPVHTAAADTDDSRLRLDAKPIELMAESFAWGILAGSPFVLGGVLALLVPIARVALGLSMAFGTGVLIRAL
jgi:hypothetical protein